VDTGIRRHDGGAWVRVSVSRAIGIKGPATKSGAADPRIRNVRRAKSISHSPEASTGRLPPETSLALRNAIFVNAMRP
jgi:hypothetical protein